MSLLYSLLGAITVIVIYLAYKPIRKLLSKVKLHRKDVSEIKELRSDIDRLWDISKELATELQQLKEVTDETQKNNTLLFPERFDTDQTDGKTIFVKEGEEKAYDTVDWRSR
jgi:hypothetical protein